MAKAKSLYEALNTLVIFMFCVIQLIIKLFILEIDIGDTWKVLNTLRVILAKLVAIDGKLLELHDVLREGASFITEYVMNHPQFLVQVGRLAKCWKVSILIVDLDVPRNELSLNKVDHLDGDQQ